MAPLTSGEQTVAAVDQPIFPLGIAVAATSDCAPQIIHAPGDTLVVVEFSRSEPAHHRRFRTRRTCRS